MKTFIGIILLLFLVGCDPPRDLYQGIVTIKGQVLNPKDSINLGDSVAFYFEVPDSISYNNASIKTYSTNKDGCEVGMFPQRIDSATGNIPGDGTLGIFIANPGNVVNRFSLQLSVVNNRLLGKFYYIPAKRGVYFLEVQANGYIAINDGSIKANNTFNFGNINRHHQLILSNANPTLNMTAFLNDKINRGLEVYAFYVK